MTVGDLMKICSEEDYVCVYDIATDTYLYDSYLCNNQTYDSEVFDGPFPNVLFFVKGFREVADRLGLREIVKE